MQNEVRIIMHVIVNTVLVQDGWTSLHCASQCGSVEIVEMLIAAGSNINAVNKVR